MKVLVLGSGGREHALVWKLRQSCLVSEVYCMPGNAGIANEATVVPGRPNDPQEVADFAVREGIDLTVVGPEAPLVAGVADELERRGLAVFGPIRDAAMLEGSKVFAKEFMKRHGIPTADYRVFADAGEAMAYVSIADKPLVVKADGLAAGKGVVVARSAEEAARAVEDMMVRRIYGEAGSRVVIEECLEGEEVSVLAFTDGRGVLPLASSQDHKRAFDNDEGPNTGGMGAYSPAPIYTPEMAERVEREILLPTVRGLRQEGRPYRGVIYAGLMLTAEGPMVLEFNCRFGDPETQAILPRLETDLFDVMLACARGDLGGRELRWRPEAAVCVVMASAGYPGPYRSGVPIKGLEGVACLKNVFVFHAGTARRDGELVTAGGRVLGVTALGAGVREAAERAYEAVGQIRFDGAHYRRDIARRAFRFSS